MSSLDCFSSYLTILTFQKYRIRPYWHSMGPYEVILFRLGSIFIHNIYKSKCILLADDADIYHIINPSLAASADWSKENFIFTTQLNKPCNFQWIQKCP